MQESSEGQDWIGWVVGVGGLLIAIATKLIAGGRWVERSEARDQRIVTEIKLHIQEELQETRHGLRNEIQAAKGERYIFLDDRIKHLDQEVRALSQRVAVMEQELRTRRGPR